MPPDVSAPPSPLRVQRHFEANRLAGDCQALAYEQVLSRVAPAEITPGPGLPQSAAGDEPLLTGRGVAA
jgi:hypothetical protein